MVVLPQPLGPTMATNSDRLMSRFTSTQASTIPFLVVYCLLTPCSRMYGSVINSVRHPSRSLSNDAKASEGDRRFSFLWQVGSLRQEGVCVVNVQVGLWLQLGELLQQVLCVLPVVDRGPAERFALGVLGVDDRHRAVDLQQRDLLVERWRALEEDISCLVAMVQSVLPAAL